MRWILHWNGMQDGWWKSWTWSVEQSMHLSVMQLYRREMDTLLRFQMLHYCDSGCRPDSSRSRPGPAPLAAESGWIRTVWATPARKIQHAHDGQGVQGEVLSCPQAVKGQGEDVVNFSVTLPPRRATGSAQSCTRTEQRNPPFTAIFLHAPRYLYFGRLDAHQGALGLRNEVSAASIRDQPFTRAHCLRKINPIQGIITWFPTSQPSDGRPQYCHRQAGPWTSWDRRIQHHIRIPPAWPYLSSETVCQWQCSQLIVAVPARIPSGKDRRPASTVTMRVIIRPDSDVWTTSSRVVVKGEYVRHPRLSCLEFNFVRDSLVLRAAFIEVWTRRSWVVVPGRWALFALIPSTASPLVPCVFGMGRTCAPVAGWGEMSNHNKKARSSMFCRLGHHILVWYLPLCCVWSVVHPRCSTRRKVLPSFTGRKTSIRPCGGVGSRFDTSL